MNSTKSTSDSKSKDVLLPMLCLFTFFPLQSLLMAGETIAAFTAVYYVLLFLRTLVSIVSLYLYIKNNLRFDSYCTTIVLLLMLMFFSSVLNGSFKLSSLFSELLPLIGFCLLCKYYSTMKGYRYLFEAAYRLFGLLCIIGCLSIFLFPNGFNNVSNKASAIFFLGSKNASFFYFWTFLFLASQKSLVEFGRINYRILMCTAFFIAALFVCDSINGMLMLLAVFVFFLAQNRNWLFCRLLNPMSVCLMVIVVAVLSSFANTGLFDNVFNLLGRNSSFSGRTLFWNQALEIIRENPIIGGGVNTLFQMASINATTYALQAHNTYLDYAAKYGLPVLLLLIVFHINSLNRVWAVEDRSVARNACLFIFVMMIHGLFDSNSLYFIVLLTIVVESFDTDKKRFKPPEKVTSNKTCIKKK